MKFRRTLIAQDVLAQDSPAVARRWSLGALALAAVAGCGPLDEAPAGLDGLDDVVALSDDGASTASQALSAAPACSAAKVAELLAPATDGAPSVSLNCSVTLDKASYTITKRVVFSGAGASGGTLDCNGSTIRAAGTDVLVKSSQRDDGSWSVPDTVTVRRCKVEGIMRVKGFSPVADSSHALGHTERAQAASPKRVTFDRVTITSAGETPLYLHVGTVSFTLKDSTLAGSSNSIGIYLDAESADNTITGNTFNVVTGQGREVIAVDGSARNTISNNTFKGVASGGVFLYRNCGETGNVRHQTPTQNAIIGNYFEVSGALPAVWLASRNGNRNYCDLDAAYPFGSGASNLDYAINNVVAQNQFLNRSVAEMVLVNASPNVVKANESVAARVTRTAGCVLPLGDRLDFIPHAGHYAVRAAASTATGLTYVCTAGWLSSTAGTTTQSTFSCALGDSNAGCAGVATCPAGKRVVGVRASCNLETVTLAGSEPGSRAWDGLTVVKLPDQGGSACTIGSVATDRGTADLRSLYGSASSLGFGCREYDANGGDCIIRGNLLCL